MKHDMNYSRKFVLYVSMCSGCGENHIAESNIELHERMTLNRLAGFELAPSGTQVRRSTSSTIESLGTVCSNSNPTLVNSFSDDVTSLRK